MPGERGGGRVCNPSVGQSEIPDASDFPLGKRRSGPKLEAVPGSFSALAHHVSARSTICLRRFARQFPEMTALLWPKVCRAEHLRAVTPHLTAKPRRAFVSPVFLRNH